ncbi:hypothetical protein ACQJBY_001183 [Aegilops geniculata]
MSELQRSSQTFRRSGSSGLIWEERFMPKDQNQRNQGAAGEAEVNSLELKELRHSRSNGSRGGRKVPHNLPNPEVLSWK